MIGGALWHMRDDSKDARDHSNNQNARALQDATAGGNIIPESAVIRFAGFSAVSASRSSSRARSPPRSPAVLSALLRSGSDRV